MRFTVLSLQILTSTGDFTSQRKAHEFNITNLYFSQWAESICSRSAQIVASFANLSHSASTIGQAVTQWLVVRNILESNQL